MMDVNKLWKDRFQLYIKDTRRYLRLIFNDHFKFVLLFAIGGGAFYYQKWLQTLPEDYPIAIIIAVILGAFLTHCPIRTFLKEADIVFLLPAETEMKPYFQKSILYSYLMQCYLLIFVLAALGPLYLQQAHASISKLMMILFLLLVGKAMNIWIRWFLQYSMDTTMSKADVVTRFALNFSFVYLVTVDAKWIFIALIALLYLLLLFYFSLYKKDKSLKWEQLIELESKRMMTFYKIANMFTDVPKYKEHIKKRSWLNWLTSYLSFEEKSTFSFLYYRTFSRSSDYFGIYVRLLILGSILLYVLSLDYSKLFVIILFLYLSGFQLQPIYKHHSMKIWVDLYPIALKVKQTNFLQMIFLLLVAESIFFSCVIFFTENIVLTLLALLISFSFSYAFTFLYVKKNIKKW